MYYVIKAPHSRTDKILFSTNEKPEEFDMYYKFYDINNVNVIESSVEPNLRMYKPANLDKESAMWGENHGLCYFKENSIYKDRTFRSENIEEAKKFYEEEDK